MFSAYEQIADLLTPVVEKSYSRIFPKKPKSKCKPEIEKKAIEIARYVLPIGTFTSLYHTISILDLLRYYKKCGGYDVPAEQTLL